MKTQKPYTAELTKEVIDAYKSGMPVVAIAKLVDKTPKSVISKLSKEKVYVSPTKKVATDPKLTKSELIKQISEALGTSEELLESLEKANLGVLVIMAKALSAPLPDTDQFEQFGEHFPLD